MYFIIDALDPTKQLPFVFATRTLLWNEVVRQQSKTHDLILSSREPLDGASSAFCITGKHAKHLENQAFKDCEMFANKAYKATNKEAEYSFDAASQLLRLLHAVIQASGDILIGRAEDYFIVDALNQRKKPSLMDSLFATRSVTWREELGDSTTQQNILENRIPTDGGSKAFYLTGEKAVMLAAQARTEADMLTLEHASDTAISLLFKLSNVINTVGDIIIR